VYPRKIVRVSYTDRCEPLSLTPQEVAIEAELPKQRILLALMRMASGHARLDALHSEMEAASGTEKKAETSDSS
jgi:hypothetical protein